MYLGSFDPVHSAHVSIPVKIKDQYLLDEIIYIPTGKSPVNRKFEASSLDRITMLKNATKRYDFITVSDFEVTSENVSYSVDTVRHYKSEYDNCLMRLIIGEDNFVNFTEWHNYRDILSISNIIVLSRDKPFKYDKIKQLESYIVENINLFNKAESEKIHFSRSYTSNLSSTMLRDLMNQKKSIKQYVTKENFEYIEKNGLYR